MSIYGFSPKIVFIIMHLLFKKCKKPHYCMDFQPKVWNFQMALYSIDVYQYHSPQKHSPTNSTHNPSFQVYIYIFSKFMTCIIL
jgi:hypothetical protein